MPRFNNYPAAYMQQKPANGRVADVDPIPECGAVDTTERSREDVEQGLRQTSSELVSCQSTGLAPPEHRSERTRTAAQLAWNPIGSGSPVPQHECRP